MTTLEIIIRGALIVALLALAVGLVIWSEERYGTPRKRSNNRRSSL